VDGNEEWKNVDLHEAGYVGEGGTLSSAVGSDEGSIRPCDVIITVIRSSECS